jgi:hypothetical protein
MKSKQENGKAKRGSWLCSKGHSTGGRASVCKVCGELKPFSKLSHDLLLKLIKDIGGIGILKQFVSDAREAENKLAAFGGLPGAEQAIADFTSLQKSIEEAAG